MLKFLGKLFNRDLTTPAEPIDTNVSEDEIWEILHPTNKAELSKRKKNLQRFLQFATSHLTKTESQRLCRIGKSALNDTEDSFEALSEVASGEDGQRRGKWVFIQLDWKAREEITWQVSEILSTLGFGERWEHDCEAEFRSVHEALLSLSEWLTARGLALLHFETNSDFYCSFIVKSSDVASAKELAAEAQLTLYDHAEFLRQNT
ncbi:DUF6630 family protein [Pseudothauera rhizosphaerae]|uniref:DUF6630 domain-containing protein n=1 Tax=Pseudothauera rhizosphaerae TaxID=2565932 RepID=A0A4S4AMK3_9RHOO|nr:hypothetical protein [Pseudothauera rhizosphaerae]THF60805.1 hypothetical protein E6O51_11200 [Pseudothauera rhizosphaerae]